ncbi:MAG TPA: hypothetical protein VK386_02515, partial [Acidimicrobiales bacterium]|nr:hypothetical protein [Acidimicrobiales bacterium]
LSATDTAVSAAGHQLSATDTAVSAAGHRLPTTDTAVSTAGRGLPPADPSVPRGLDRSGSRYQQGAVTWVVHRARK